MKIRHDVRHPATARWVRQRKEEVVKSVLQGSISLGEVCRRYQLSVEEFLCWRREIAVGASAVKTSKKQTRQKIPRR